MVQHGEQVTSAPQRLFEFVGGLFDAHKTIEEMLQLVAQKTVDVLGASACVISLQRDNKSVAEIRAITRANATNGRTQTMLLDRGQTSWEATRYSEYAAQHDTSYSAEILVGGKAMGCINAFAGPASAFASWLTQEDFVALCRQIGYAIEMQHMRQMLASRYASLALIRDELTGRQEDADSIKTQAIAAVHNPQKVARIVARSFYKDLRKAGFETKQILYIASELIENLNETFRKTKSKTE